MRPWASSPRDGQTTRTGSTPRRRGPSSRSFVPDSYVLPAPAGRRPRAHLSNSTPKANPNRTLLLPNLYHPHPTTPLPLPVVPDRYPLLPSHARPRIHSHSRQILPPLIPSRSSDLSFLLSLFLTSLFACAQRGASPTSQRIGCCKRRRLARVSA